MWQLMFWKNQKPTAKKLSDLPPWGMVEARPKVIADGVSVKLTYRSALADGRLGSASVYFPRCLQFKFGYPNEEVIDGHPLSKLGLDIWGGVEILDSPWLDEIKETNRVHRNHSDDMFSGYRHFILTYQDFILEVLAEGYQVS